MPHHLSALALLALALAGLDERPGAPRSGAARVVLESARGVVSSKPLQDFVTEDPREQGAHLVRFEDPATAPLAAARAASNDAIEVRFSNGDRLCGLVRGATGETVDVEIAGGVRVVAALEEIASLAFPGRVPPTWHGTLEPAREGDRLFRRKGTGVERIEGAVESFASDTLVFHDARIGSLTVAWKDLVALFVESTARGAERGSAGRVPVVVEVADGSRLSGALVRIDARVVALRSRGGQALDLPTQAVSSLLVDDGTLTFLSALEPALAPDSTPFGDDLGMRWPARVDRSVTGTPLVAGGRLHPRGLGVHAPSRVTWNLAAGYTDLRGAVALDDQVLRLPVTGSVVFRVWVDGAKRFESPIVRGGDAPIPFALGPTALVGARELTLEVDPSEDSFVADRADWLGLILVRERAK